MQFYNSVYVHLLRVLLRGHSCLTREYSQLFVKVSLGQLYRLPASTLIDPSLFSPKHRPRETRVSRQFFDRSTIHKTRVPITACPRSTIFLVSHIVAAIADRQTLGYPTIVAVVFVSASDTTGNFSVSGYHASTEGVSGGIVSS